MAAVKETAVGIIRGTFEPGFNTARIDKVERALRLAGFNVEGYEQTKTVVETLGFNVLDSYVWEES